ncbi:MAG: hypothetical protein QM487_08585 [Candidatus Marithrix sp.]
MKIKLLHNVFLLCLGSIFTLQSAQSYNYNSHDELTINAVTYSQLDQYLPTIGLTSFKNDDLTLIDCDGFFCDITLTIEDWFRLGARNEDATILFSKNKEDITKEDLNLARYQHHFYDPIKKSKKDGGYSFDSVLGYLTGHPSPDWGLEDNKEISNQNYSLKDARDYLYRGLTLTEEQDRESNLALLFQSLGHALHLIEDMAQPQHTRNDSHGGYIVFGEKSLYETYTEKKDILPAINFSGYAPVDLPNARDYWYTTDDKKGLADYSNRGFVTAGTNFIDELNNEQIYPSPDLSNAKESYVDIRGIYEALNKPVPKITLPDGTIQELSGTMTFIGTEVKDYYRPETTITNEKTSTFSIFNADLKKYNECFDHYESDPNEDFNKKVYRICELYTLNRFNFDAAHKLLIPRAVGYGAGFINHFFRGKLEINVPEEGLYPINKIDERGFAAVKLNLKNITPDIGTIDQNMNDGEVTLVAEYKINDSENFIVSTKQPLTLAVQAEQTLTFDFSYQPIPIDATEVSFQIVYQGRLGQDEAVVVANKKYIGGKLKITIPEEDIYSIVDHSQIKTINQGFTTLKLKLQNITPDINGIPQNMTNGKLVLIAKYRRNDCYESDLSGEYTKLGFGGFPFWYKVPVRGNGCKNKYPYGEYTSVSVEQNLSLTSQAEQILTFDFSEQPIPINATKLYIQAIYQGQLGNNKAVVIATKDIAEPTYFSIINLSDYFAIDGIYYHILNDILTNETLEQRVRDANIMLYPKTLKIGIRTQDNKPLLEMENLEAGSYMRIALLVDRGTFELKTTVSTKYFGIWSDNKSNYRVSARNEDWDSYTLYRYVRGVYHWESIEFHGASSIDGNTPDISKFPDFTPENLEPKPVTILFGTEGSN